MHTSLLPHALSVEFPSLADKIHSLKQTDVHFAKLLAEHDELDKKITRDEAKIEGLSDDSLHELKQRRALIKDQLYQIVSK
jgi:uncharacterized protein YdcH (DUF465 family)